MFCRHYGGKSFLDPKATARPRRTTTAYPATAPPQVEPKQHGVPTTQESPTQSSQPRTPATTYLVGALITSGIGGLLLLIMEFGGGYGYWYYVEGWLSISTYSTVYGALVLIPLSLGLFYCCYLSFEGLQSPSTLSASKLKRGLVISSIVTSVVLVLGLVFMAYFWGEYDELWFGAGFYGGSIGGLFTAILFWLSLKQV